MTLSPCSVGPYTLSALVVWAHVLWIVSVRSIHGSMYGSWMDGWIMDGSVDRSMDRSIDHWWMDGFIHSSSHSSIHPLTPVGEVFIPLKRATGKIERSSLNFLFSFVNKFLLFSDREPLLPVIGWCAQLLPLWNLKNKTELWSFLKFGFLSVFTCSPLVPGEWKSQIMTEKRPQGGANCVGGFDVGGATQNN